MPGSAESTTSGGCRLGPGGAGARRRRPSPQAAGRAPGDHPQVLDREHEGYITVGLYEDGQPGEIFLVMAKEGSTISGLMDAFATAISLALQYGVPLRALVDKFSHMRFEPSGFTKKPRDPDRQVDHRLHLPLVGVEILEPRGEGSGRGHPARFGRPRRLPAPASRRSQTSATIAAEQPRITFQTSTDAPSCHDCGSIMVRNGSCYKCLNCGSTSGCS